MKEYKQKNTAMKQILTLVMMLVVAIGAQAQVDDMYFVPKKKKVKTVEEDSSYSFETTQERFTTPERDADEYNRRRSVSNSPNNNDEEYSDEEYTSDDEDTEYRYSSRIVRFHNPHRVIVSSPWYWDVVYTSGVDNWVVYDDGIYWEVYPTYSSWYYPSWSWSYGWAHYPYYWGPYTCWSGWYASPHWWHHHYHGHFHHNWGGHYNNHFASGGHFRDGRIPPVTNLRTGNTIARSTDIERNNGLRRGDSSDRLAQNRGGNRGGTKVERSTVSRRGQSGNNRGTVNERRNSINRSTVGSSSRTNNRGTVRRNNEKERNYDRPSSTRNTQRSTSVERSSSNNRSYSGSSRSSGGSRSGGVSRGGGGGSHGGGRR